LYNIDAETAQRELRAASYELHLATTPPQDWLHGFPYVTTEVGAVRSLLDLGILAAIPSDGANTYKDLAHRLGINQDVVERLCRFTITFGFLQSSKPHTVEHSATSRLAIYNALGVGFNIQHFPSSAYRMSDALRVNSNAREPDTCGFALAHRHEGVRSIKTPRTLWQILETDSTMAASFMACMQFTNQSSQLGGAWIQDAFDWNTLPRNATVVDVGGSRGHVMLGLAERFPLLRYIVQDISISTDNVARLDNVSFMTHDFFTPQPIQADVFFFRKVFHDWSDAYCQQILRALGPALKPGVKLMINDIVLPDPKGRPDYDEYVARRMDIAMMVMVNGKQRSRHQWQALVCGASPGWQLESVTMQDGSMNGLLVFTYS
jgi:hypothetical protein